LEITSVHVQGVPRLQSTGSITNWIRQLKKGDAVAIQRLWEIYFRRLVRLARRKLAPVRLRTADEEDVALSAFDSFFRGAHKGHFPQLRDRDDLWQILVVLTRRKAVNQIKRERRQKRGGGWTQEQTGQDFANLISSEPDPKFAAQIAEEYRCLLDQLGERGLQLIAEWKLGRYTNAEIAERLQLSIATVERKLRLIRKICQSEVC
jgi:DNA-directed RNA polymerase specialized sigma24 family protein